MLAPLFVFCQNAQFSSPSWCGRAGDRGPGQPAAAVVPRTQRPHHPGAGAAAGELRPHGRTLERVLPVPNSCRPLKLPSSCYVFFSTMTFFLRRGGSPKWFCVFRMLFWELAPCLWRLRALLLDPPPVISRIEMQKKKVGKQCLCLGFSRNDRCICWKKATFHLDLGFLMIWRFFKLLGLEIGWTRGRGGSTFLVVWFFLRPFCVCFSFFCFFIDIWILKFCFLVIPEERKNLFFFINGSFSEKTPQGQGSPDPPLVPGRGGRGPWEPKFLFLGALRQETFSWRTIADFR